MSCLDITTSFGLSTTIDVRAREGGGDMAEPFLNITEFHHAVAANLATGSSHLAKIEVSNLSWIGSQYGETAVATSMRGLHELLAELFDGVTVGRVSTSLLGITAPGSVDGKDFLARLERLRTDINRRHTMPYLVEVAVGYVYANQRASSEVSVWIEAANVALIESVRRRRLVAYSAQLEDMQFLRVHVSRLAAKNEAPMGMYWVFQPVIDLATGDVVFSEALIRWYLDGFGDVAPDQFIPLAEDLDVVETIDRWTVMNAVALLSGIPAEQRIPISVNVSARTFSEQRGLASFVVEKLRQFGVAGESLIVELTESAAIDDIGHLSRELNTLAEVGVRMAIDDFGKGQTNLFTLASLPVAVLKLDRTLFDLQDPERMAQMLSVGVGLGHTIGARVLAEGIETPAQREAAVEAGVDYAQGWLIGEAVSELPTRALRGELPTP
ncbi:MAG TPA: EAL domain-containing protein [Microbacteriaceae bacterium]|nr:EAL domain-containing protein [Microbacteriaceae bacterium]